MMRSSVFQRFYRCNRLVSNNFFWKNQQQQEQQGQVDNQPQDQWKGKEKFLTELRQKREEYEKLKSRASMENKYEDQRSKREDEVNYGGVDYANVIIQNINITALQQFQHPQELFNFISGLRVKLTEETLICVTHGFIQLADLLEQADTQRPEFQEFLQLLAQQVKIISKEQNLVALFQFLDLYCVESKHAIWEKAEVYLMSRIGKINIESLIQILKNLSNQREGSELLWDHCEQHLLGKLEQEMDVVKQTDHVINIVISYWKSQKGQIYYNIPPLDKFYSINIKTIISKQQLFFKQLIQQNSTQPFIQAICKHIDLALQDESVRDRLNINNLIQIALIYSQLSLIKNQKQKVPTTAESELRTFKLLEMSLIKKIEEMDFNQICSTAKSFGFNYGTDEFFKSLEEKVLTNFDKLSIQELRLIVQGFLLSYRGSKQLFKLCQDRIIAAQHDFTVEEFSEIAKAYHITENEDQSFLFEIERFVVRRLKDVKDVTIEEIHAIAKSYLITRIGSRELYRLLEIVVKYRINDIRQNEKILQGLYNLFVSSGLCTPKLLELLEILK